MFKKVIGKFKNRVINKPKDVDYYVNEIKKELSSTREDNIKMWLPSNLCSKIESILMNDMNYDLAFLRSDNNGNFLMYISPYVDYNSIINKTR